MRADRSIRSCSRLRPPLPSPSAAAVAAIGFLLGSRSATDAFRPPSPTVKYRRRADCVVVVGGGASIGGGPYPPLPPTRGDRLLSTFYSPESGSPNRAESVDGNGNGAVGGDADAPDVTFPLRSVKKSRGEPRGPRRRGVHSIHAGNGDARSNNPAFNDPSFLRKRTETLLRVTGDAYLRGDDDDGGGADAGAGAVAGGGSRNVGGGGMKADKRTFEWLIDAWAFSGELDAYDMAMALLARMEELRDRGAEDGGDGDGLPSHVRPIRPDVRSYSKVINAISRSGRTDAGEMAEAVLGRMEQRSDVQPNGYTYTGVIEAYGRSGSPDAAPRAEALVERMEALRSAGDPDVRPTARSWNSVIHAWAQSGEGDAAQRAEDCLDRMEELAALTDNDDVRPNSYNYNSVINAWATSREEGAANRAEAILERMERLNREGEERVKPRTATYNAVIDAWAKSGEPDAANRAELLLGHMKELYETGHNVNAKPNVRSFNSVLNAWAKSRDAEAPERATEVLQRMEELSLSSKHWADISPDATSFSTAINAYARSHFFGKAQAAYEIFLHMKDLHEASGKPNLRPNAVVYNSVLNACAFTVGDLVEQSRATEIASSMLRALDDSPYGNPDQVTYGTYLKVIAHQMPPSDSRTRIVGAVFRKCASDGMVGDFVLRMLREAVFDGESFLELTGKSLGEELRLSEVPDSWTCNVIEGKRLRRRKFRR